MFHKFDNVFVVLHNVHSVSKVVDTAQVVYGMGFPTFIVSKPEGAAAQSGVPDANKLALKMNGRFIVLPDLSDAIELLGVARPLMLVSPMLTKNRVNLHDLSRQVTNGERVMITLSGSTSSFSRREMDLGECVSIDSQIDIGPAATASVLLHAIKSAQQ